MKKLMIAVASLSLCAAVHSESVTSDNVVGYDAEATRGGYNYVIPTFRTVGVSEAELKNATDIQQFQLGASVDSGAATFQFLKANRRSAAEYTWIAAEDASDVKEDWPAGKGLWVDENSEFPSETVTVAVGNAVQLDMGDYDVVSLTCAGQVSDDDLSYTTRAGYNYVGNPYPQANDIQNIQLNAGVDSGAATFQFLKANRRSAAEFTWISPEDAKDVNADWPDGLGLWVNEDSEFPAPAVMMQPGQAVQLDMGDMNQEVITVYAPIEL